MEAVAADPGHAFPRHTHGQSDIGITNRGAQKSFNGRGTVETGAGGIIIVNPLEVHDGALTGDAGRVWCTLYLDPGMVVDTAVDLHPGHCDDAEFDRPVIRNATLVLHVHLLFTQMTMSGTRGDALLHEQLPLSVPAGTLRPANRPADHHTDTVPDTIRPTCTRTNGSPAAAIPLPDLTHETSLNRFQVLRDFARVTGSTSHAYQVQRRVTLAHRLIAQGEPLTEVTATCGLAGQSHMTRQLVRRYGVSPGIAAATC